MARSLVVTAFLVVAALHLVAAQVSNARPGGLGRGFPCKIRPAGHPGQPLRTRWPLRRCRAAWVHNVLVISRGLTFPQVTALGVRMAEDTLRETCTRELRGLGARPLVLRLRLDDGRLVEIAARGRHRTELVGPFMAVAIPGLSAGPKKRRDAGR